jgi:sugar phosphate permease
MIFLATNNFRGINMQNSSFRPWLIWSLGAAYFLAEYFARVSPGVMVPELMQAFNATALALGTLSAFFYLAYIPMQIPVGMLVDRYGPHRLLSIMALLCGLSCFAFAAVSDIHLAQLSRFLMGFTASFAFVGTLKLASMWFPAERFGLLAGLTQALGMLGAVIGEAPTAIAVQYFHWRGTLIIMGVVIVILAILIALIVRDKPQAHHPVDLKQESVGLFKGLWLVLQNPQTWINGFYVGLLYAPTAAFAELWGVNFLRHTYHLTAAVAGAAIGCIFIGWTIGGPITGWVSDKMLRRKPVLLLSSFCGIILMSIIIFIPLSLPAIFVLLFCYGMTNTGVAISYAIASEINPPRINGTSIAFANMASVLIGACFQPIIGWVLDMHWQGTMANGIRIFTTGDYHTALAALPVCSLLSLFFAFFVKETYCRNVAVK